MDVHEIAGLTLTIIGGVGSFGAWLYKKILKPFFKMTEDHNSMLGHIHEIRKEFVTNSGKSLKDAINRIEDRQVVIDHRSRAILSEIEKPIFEVDSSGNILWANQPFFDILKHDNVKSLDWINVIKEDERQLFISEFKSCSQDLRELLVTISTTDGTIYSLHGFPYRDLAKKSHHGFLVFLKKEK